MVTPWRWRRGRRANRRAHAGQARCPRVTATGGVPADHAYRRSERIERDLPPMQIQPTYPRHPGPPCSCMDAWQTRWSSALGRGGPHTVGDQGQALRDMCARCGARSRSGMMVGDRRWSRRSQVEEVRLRSVEVDLVIVASWTSDGVSRPRPGGARQDRFRAQASVLADRSPPGRARCRRKPRWRALTPGRASDMT